MKTGVLLLIAAAVCAAERVDVNKADADGTTPLIWAAAENNELPK